MVEIGHHREAGGKGGEASQSAIRAGLRERPGEDRRVCPIGRPKASQRPQRRLLLCLRLLLICLSSWVLALGITY